MKTIAHLSGGFDSLAAILLELRQGLYVGGLFIDYGQEYAKQEKLAAEKLSERLSKNFRWMGLHCAKMELVCKSQTQVDFYVPMRNLALIAQAVNLACAIKFDAVTVGMHTIKRRPDDPFCFRDASIAFISRLQSVLDEACEGTPIELRMPLILDRRAMTKGEIFQVIKESGIDLTDCWNCFQSGDKPCGECFHCKERLKTLAELETAGI